MAKKEDCFAWRELPIGWSCAALNVESCEFPKCKTFKTREQIVEQKKRCKARIDSYPAPYRAYLIEKYGKYETEEEKLPKK